MERGEGGAEYTFLRVISLYSNGRALDARHMGSLQYPYYYKRIARRTKTFSVELIGTTTFSPAPPYNNWEFILFIDYNGLRNTLSMPGNISAATPGAPARPSASTLPNTIASASTISTKCLASGFPG